MKKARTKKNIALGVVVAAAGQAARMEGLDKQLMELDGVPVLVRSIQGFQRCRQVREIVVVCKEGAAPDILELVHRYRLDKVSKIISGAATRQQSVFGGVAELGGDITHCAVHDGARPFVTQDIIQGCIRDLSEYDAVAAAVKIKDTIKQADSEGFIAGTLDREPLRAVQTPQMFEIELYRRAMEEAVLQGADFTDDCKLIENIGGRVYLSKGDEMNIKITTQQDIVLAQAICLLQREGELAWI